MPTQQINEGQTLLDIAVQHLGNVALAYDLAIENGLNFSDDLILGSAIEVGEVAVEKKKIVTFFKNKNIVPASKKDEDLFKNEGIGYWAIGYDFIVQ